MKRRGRGAEGEEGEEEEGVRGEEPQAAGKGGQSRRGQASWIGLDDPGSDREVDGWASINVKARKWNSDDHKKMKRRAAPGKKGEEEEKRKKKSAPTKAQ
jgi:hypothetical protein